MGRDFKLKGLNKVMSVRFKTEEGKVEFERKFSELLKREGGEILKKSDDLMDFSFYSYNEMYRDETRNLMKLLATEAYSSVDNKNLKDDKNTEVTAIFQESGGFFGFSLEVNSGVRRTLCGEVCAVRKELKELIERLDVANNICSSIDSGGESDIRAVCTLKDVKKDVVLLKNRSKVKNGQKISEGIIHLLNEEFVLQDDSFTNTSFSEGFLNPVMSDKEKNGYKHLT